MAGVCVIRLTAGRKSCDAANCPLIGALVVQPASSFQRVVTELHLFYFNVMEVHLLFSSSHFRYSFFFIDLVISEFFFVLKNFSKK